MNELLQRAINSLRIRDVYLRSSHASIADGFEPKYEVEAANLAVQFKHLVTSSHVMELNGDGVEERIFRVFIDLGARWVSESSSVDTEEPEVKAVIEAVMVAEYTMTEDPGTEALKSFAFSNASFHVWPYWREFVSSHCLRMNLPKFTIPAVQFPINRDQE